MASSRWLARREQPLALTHMIGRYDVYATSNGGGLTGYQREALGFGVVLASLCAVSVLGVAGMSRIGAMADRIIEEDG